MAVSGASVSSSIPIVREYIPQMPTPVRNRKLSGLVRATTYPHLFGEDVAQKRGMAGPKQVRPSYPSDEFVAAYNNGPRWLKRWKAKDFGRHLNDDLSLYFMGAASRRARFTLAKIDIDCHGGERGAGAARQAVSGRFPRVAWEAKGDGYHGYVLIYKEWVDCRAVNRLLRDRLEPYLRHLTAGCDISAIEVKGLAPEIEYERGQIRTFKFGSLAKMPRLVEVEDLKRAVITCDELHELTKDLPLEVIKKSGRKDGPDSRSTCKAGSYSGKLISEDQLAALSMIEKYAELLLDGEELVPNGTRAKVTSRDVAFGLLLLHFFRLRPNSDLSLPQARVKALWKGVYEAGDFDRSWHTTRWAAISRFLWDRGWVDWFDHEFEPGVNGKKGVACKWQVCDGIFEAIDRMIAAAAEKGPRGAPFGSTSFDLNVERPVPSTVKCRPKLGRVKDRKWMALLAKVNVQVEDLLLMAA